MVSVERLHEYHELPSEAPFKLDHDKDIDDNWPASPDIIVKDLTARYRSTLPVCLDRLSFNVRAGERIGVVGRTGSGKSSLVQALLRLLEAETGFIEVDGVDISSIGLHRLRTSMAVIPQHPVLFSGYTVRDNLDPFTKYGDDAIWDALESVQMADVIEALPLKLDSAVAQEGGNFSVGQRQLLCLARAILLRNNIIILDEPSANVDSKTDQLLQKTLRERFSQATIISIAHRLDTIIDYDKVLVLSDGKMIEFGSPSDLLSKEGGHFLSLVNSTGDAMARSLFKRAQARDRDTGDLE
jgi:ABC-type multidrug transport system fused ATPase/permease subunit